MMPVIRISDQTWARLQKFAQPLVDTPESVINAALDALDAKDGNVRPKNLLAKLAEDKRTKNKELTPQKEFRPILLKTLFALGGQASVSKIKSAMQDRVKSILKPGDNEIVSSGDIRWWNAVCWERADLVREGLFRSDSARGTWGLTERGKAEARKL